MTCHLTCLLHDDTKIYRELSNIARDSEALQFVVNQLVSWASKWQLRFNSGKCELLHITHKRHLSLSPYSLGTSLKTVKCVKNLGKRFLRIYPAANTLLWLLIKQTNYCSQNDRFVESRCNPRYTNLLCALFLYTLLPPVWSPFLSKNVLAEKFSEEPLSPLSSKNVSGEMENEDRLRKLKWPTLETSRFFLSLVECYKIVFGINKLNFDDFLNLTSTIQPAQTTRISYMLSQQKAIHVNILFLSESCGTGIVYQGLLLRLGRAWTVLRVR